MSDDNKLVSRRDYIAGVMKKQGNHRNPHKYIVLQGWDTIVDDDMTYQIKVPDAPTDLVGAEVYAIVRPDSPDLGKVKVLEDRGVSPSGDHGLWVQHLDNKAKVQFLVPRDEIRMLPIPFRPLAILRSDLRLYIGDDAAKIWHDNRRMKRGKRTTQE